MNTRLVGSEMCIRDRDNELFEIDEPFKKLLTQGMVQAAAYKNNKTGKYVSPSDITDLSKSYRSN